MNSKKKGRHEKMLFTSAEANKLLRKLFDEHTDLLKKERDACVFKAATVENVEDARPEYDYAAVQAKLLKLEKDIRTIKHAISAFNLSQEIPNTGMTIDQILVYIPQLSERKRKLSEMKQKLKKQRDEGYSTNSHFIEYIYTNYDPSQAAMDYDAVSDELGRIQNALDLVNSTVQFEINL